MSLVTIPSELLDKIVDGTDYATIQSIRKVSRSLRSFIDGLALKHTMYELSLDVFDDFMKIQWFHTPGRSPPVLFNTVLQEYNMYYSQEKFGVYVDGGRSVDKLLKGEKVHTIGYDDLERLLNSSGSNLTNLRTSFYPVGKEEYRQDYLQFKEKLSNLFATRERRLTAENTCFKVTDQSEILLVLPHIVPTSVEDIFIEDSRTIKGEPFDIGQVVLTPQWKNARTLTLENCVLSAPLKHFSHFDEAYIHMGAISVEDVVELKNGVINRRDFDKFKRIHLYYKSVDNEEKLIQLLGEQTADWAYLKVWLYATKDKRTAIRMEKFDNLITFQNRYVCPNMRLIPLE